MKIFIRAFLPLLVGFFIITGKPAQAQTKIGFVDSEKLVAVLPESNDAQQRLDNLVSEWQTEISALNDSLSKLEKDFENKKLILTEELKAQLLQNIDNLKKYIETFKVNKFGEGGEYFQKQREFVKPVQEKIYDAILKVAEKENFDYVFDRNSDIFLMYVNEQYDLTQKVIKILTGN